MESAARKLGLQINQEKTNALRQKTGHLKIKDDKFESVKYLGVILHEDNKHQIHLQERIKKANKT
jgi:hypothetical protein